MTTNPTNKTQNTELKFRPTAFCLIIDLKKKLILVENGFGLVGGGIDQGELPIDTCIREVWEETEGAIIIDKNNLHFYDTIQFQTPDFFTDNQTWNGKKGFIYAYQYDSTLFTGIGANTTDIPHGKLEWFDIDKFFTLNNDIDPIQFKKFCLTISNKENLDSSLIMKEKIMCKYKN